MIIFISTITIFLLVCFLSKFVDTSEIDIYKNTKFRVKVTNETNKYILQEKSFLIWKNVKDYYCVSYEDIINFLKNKNIDISGVSIA